MKSERWVWTSSGYRKRIICPQNWIILVVLFILLNHYEGKERLGAEGAGQRPVEIHFGSETNGVPWELKPEKESLSVIPGEAVRGVFRLRSRASRRATVLVRHKFDPPEMIRYLPTLECGLQFTITMDPGEEQDFESEFFLREGVPKGRGLTRIIFTFELLDEPYGSKELKRGRDIFVRRCTTCHGSDGKGETSLAKRFSAPPTDLRASVRERNDWQLLRVLTEGKGMMPAFSPAIDEKELRNVVYYLRAKWGDKG